jgi:hypothetical protein
MSFTRRKFPFMANYSISGSVLEKVTSFCDLGVTLDETLTFNRHIDSIISKANGKLGFIRRCASEFYDPYALKSLYAAFVRSILEYASVVWAPNYEIHIKRIESVQKKFVRYALRKLGWSDPFRLPEYTARCTLIDLQTLESRRDISAFCFVLNLLQAEIDSDELLNELVPLSNTYNLRNADYLRLTTRRTNYGQHSPLYRSAFIFNKYFSPVYFDLSVPAVKRLVGNVIGNLRS